MKIFYTVCNRNSLPHALVLAESLATHHPGEKFIIAWVDNIPLPALPENCELLAIADLAIPNFSPIAASYYDFELLAASRPWFAKYIFQTKTDCQKLTFLAPTVLLLQNVTEILSVDSDIILTPHIVKPLPKKSELLDRRILNIGMFHSNSWTMKRSIQTLDFLEWWSTRTTDRAKFDLCEGMCMDQLWLNFAPVRILNWSKSKHTGWHYGLNAVPGLKLEEKGGRYYSEGNPLLSIDFTGLLLFDPIWSDYASLISGSSAFRNLLNEYRRKVSLINSQLDIPGAPGFGMIPDISSMRTVRNKWAEQLKKATRFIDQVQI